MRVGAMFVLKCFLFFFGKKDNSKNRPCQHSVLGSGNTWIQITCSQVNHVLRCVYHSAFPVGTTSTAFVVFFLQGRSRGTKSGRRTNCRDSPGRLKLYSVLFYKLMMGLDFRIVHFKYRRRDLVKRSLGVFEFEVVLLTYLTCLVSFNPQFMDFETLCFSF